MIIAGKIPDEQQEQKNGKRLEIYTLGRFLVRRGKQLFSEDAGKSHQLWRLFKYLLTYYDKTIHPELLIEALYPEEELKDPDRALRNLIYRLRRLLAAGTSPRFDQQYIVLSQGLYSFNLSANYWLDVEEFKGLYRMADKIAPEDPAKAISLYQKALFLYKGDYLPENIYDDWVVTVREYYHRCYMKITYDLITLLKEAGRYSELKEVCEKAFSIEPLIEGLHLYYIEALLEEGKTGLAKAHYNYASSLFYRETGLKPSFKMRELYRKITGEKKIKEKSPLMFSKNRSERQESEGAFFCDPKTFLEFFRLEGIQAEKSDQGMFWGRLSFTQADGGSPDIKMMDDAMALLKKILQKSLRHGDIICRWSDREFHLILTCSEHEHAVKALERVKNSFLGCHTPGGMMLHCTTGSLATGGENLRQLQILA